MSEPNLRDWKFWATSPYMWTSLLPTLALAIAGISMGVGIYAGMRHGRAEMKRWQDDYYRMHHNCINVCEGTSEIGWKMPNCPPPPKLQKEKLHTIGKCIALGGCAYATCPQTEQEARSQCGSGVSLEPFTDLDGSKIIVAPQAKPQKGSKRSVIWEPQLNVIYCGDRPCSQFAQPIPEKEPKLDGSLPPHGQLMKKDGREYIWTEDGWTMLRKDGGLPFTVCWGDMLINDKHEGESICAPPLYDRRLKELLEQEKRLFDEGWYVPSVIMGAGVPAEKP